MLPSSVLEQLERECKARDTSKVFVQLPEGLKVHAREICNDLELAGLAPILSGERCYGACDIRAFPGAVTLHVGHSKMLDTPGIVYWEYRLDVDPRPAVQAALPRIREKRIGLATVVQHIGFLDAVREMLEKADKEVFVGKGKRTTYPGQVLGCDAEGCRAISSKVDAFLFFGTGVFHPQIIAYATRKKVYAVDPFTKEMKVVTWEGFEKERALRITKAMNARSFGVVVSEKPGQMNMGLAEGLVSRIREHGKEACMIIVDEVSPDLLDYLPYDAYVITACPRIVIDDWRNYKKPVLLPGEVEALLG